MKITTDLFEAFLKCPTKCSLLAVNEPAPGNAYAEWRRSKNESYRATATEQIVSNTPKNESVLSPSMKHLQSAKWSLAVGLVVRAQMNFCVLESAIHAVEHVSPQGPERQAQFVPIRFLLANKVGRHEKLLMAFDAFVLSEVIGHAVGVSKIVHGDDHATLKVKTKGLTAEVRKYVANITALLANPVMPDLVLNRHCVKCEFLERCRKIAVEKDDLSLLAGMSAMERQKLRSKGIFTTTQLSYTFRPRRRPKRLRDKREKYHHSLKALAIRERKIHIVGSPDLKIEGTPVYLDVEGLPDIDFYYLIGMRIGNGDSVVQHSLWADTVADENKIWCKFLSIIDTIEKPVLIHYGSYETEFLKLMIERHGGPTADSSAAKAIESSVNVLSVLYAQIYFPTYTNGLKEVAGFLGFKWSEPGLSGLQTIMLRRIWEDAESQELQRKLSNYNAEDCHALEIVTEVVQRLDALEKSDQQQETRSTQVVHTELIPLQTMWPRFKSPFVEFEKVNKAARWDYQRDRVYVRSSKGIRRIARQKTSRRGQRHSAPKTVIYRENDSCPICGQKGMRHFATTRRVLFDIYFGRFNIRRRVVEYSYHVHWCPTCRMRFGIPTEFWPRSKYGRNLVAYFIYHMVQLCIPMAVVGTGLNRLLGFNLTRPVMHNIKVMAARYYEETVKSILDRLVMGSLLHVDETRASIRGRTGYVWVFTNLHEVAYVYSDSREGEFVQKLLHDFKGVLVSDFYAAYDAIDCPQQKCLIHLMRDLNADVLSQPYNEELKKITGAFAELLKTIIETVDRYGLKRHFLHKHATLVNRFYQWLDCAEFQNEAAIKCRERFDKNRDKLFTFLNHNGVPWNNNNAEHAVKAFAHLREVLKGSCTAEALREYLVLLSVCQTCEYSGVDFLNFLRSGQKDIQAFSEKQSHLTSEKQPVTSPQVSQ